MADFRKMTVESLRELARKMLGPGQSRKTKGELVAALEAAEKKTSNVAKAARGKARTAASRAAEATGKAVRAAKQAGKAAGAGARAAARAGKAAAADVAEGVREAAKAPRTRRAAKVAAAVAGAAAGAVAGVAASVSAARARRAKVGNGKPGGPAPDPEGYFVARVRGEEAVREAPHPMTETTSDAPEAFRAVEEGEGALEAEAGAPFEENLGELPWGYGDDAFVALPRDPRTLFLYWDFSQETARAAFAGLDHPRAELRVFARNGGGWSPVRSVDFALEANGYYVHDLDPGRVYRAEIHAVDRRGEDRQIGRGSNEMMLPPLGPSPVIDDRFIRIPWEVPLGRLLGPGHAGGPFSEEARALLARLSDWSRFAARSGAVGSAGGVGGRPTSPGVSSPSSPFGGFGAGEGA
ncbi:DUF4912 domain-containing protein [Anaeromyxobacter terrae]|uniref:DUF4912 domain-containing protein n=1 Tax=Anaeromyxobacter terrae TaxID=2925406 RepID=UPI001F59D6D2|nr:DUF4912 domain-containing protein [Anaeromyxobacter sp. SG22]